MNQNPAAEQLRIAQGHFKELELAFPRLKENLLYRTAVASALVAFDNVALGDAVEPTDRSQISDGYHTFAELYEHRHLLFLSFIKSHPDAAFKTRRNKEGEEWPGCFILGVDTFVGQITYHLPEKYWEVNVPEIERNADYDGHSAADVLSRLDRLLGDFMLGD